MMTRDNLFIVMLILIISGFLFAPGCGDDDDDDSESGPGQAPDDDDDDNDDDNDDAADDDDDDDDDDDNDDNDDDATGPSTEDCEPYGYSSSPAIVRGPYLQHVTQNTIRILWQTDQPGNSIVRFGLTEELGYYFCDLEKVTHHEVEVDKLTAETGYHYVVRSDGAQSDPHLFHSAPLETSPIHFAVYGDNRTQAAEHQAVVDGITAQAPDFVINVGDVVTNGLTLGEYDSEFFDQVGDLLTTTPVYVSIGNHETQSPFYFKYFSFPNNEHWYRFDYGNARFFALDTNRLYLPGTPQYLWFEEELKKAQQDGVEWKFVFCHHPAYSEGWEGYTGEWLIRRHLLPLMVQYEVDGYFNGHTHTYERGELNGVHHILTGGGGGPLDPCVRDFDHIEMCVPVYHFVNVEIAGDTADFTAIDSEGTVIDSFSIDH